MIDATPAAYATRLHPLISFIVQAKDRGDRLSHCLVAAQVAALQTSTSHELIVIDQTCAELTVVVGTLHNAHIIGAPGRNASECRSLGARVARGEYLFFVNEGIAVTADVLAESLNVLRGGATSGSALASAPRYRSASGSAMAFCARLFALLARRFEPGFIFCTRQAFEATSESCEIFVKDNRQFGRELRRMSRFVLLSCSVTADQGSRVRIRAREQHFNPDKQDAHNPRESTRRSHCIHD